MGDVQQGRPPITADQWRTFITTLRRTRSVDQASRTAGVSRTAAYRHRRENKRFRKRWDAAVATYRRRLVRTAEKEVERRGIKGVLEPVFQGGKRVGKKRVYDSRLLTRLLEAEHPAKWSQRKRIEHSGSVAMVPHDAQQRLNDPAILLLACNLDAALTTSDIASTPRMALPLPDGS